MFVSPFPSTRPLKWLPFTQQKGGAPNQPHQGPEGDGSCICKDGYLGERTGRPEKPGGVERKQGIRRLHIGFLGRSSLSQRLDFKRCWKSILVGASEQFGLCLANPLRK